MAGAVPTCTRVNIQRIGKLILPTSSASAGRPGTSPLFGRYRLFGFCARTQEGDLIAHLVSGTFFFSTLYSKLACHPLQSLSLMKNCRPNTHTHKAIRKKQNFLRNVCKKSKRTNLQQKTCRTILEKTPLENVFIAKTRLRLHCTS